MSNPFEYSVEEDKHYALGLFKYTYGYWEIIRNELRNSNYFLVNWTVHTRTTFDIQKRSDYLITLFKKELYEPELEVTAMIKVDKKSLKKGATTAVKEKEKEKSSGKKKQSKSA